MTGNRKALHRFWMPNTWPIWIGLGILRLTGLLPHRLGLSIGKLIGRLAHTFAGSRRAIVCRNLELCFPELSIAERNALTRKHFDALGMSIIEMGMGRWASDHHMLALTSLQGVEHLNAAIESGKGIILLSAHFTTLEASGRVLSLHCPPFDAIYRRNRSEFITELLRTGRERSAATTIEKRDIKKMVRSLRAGRPVWYAPDQSYDRKGAEVIDFFGVPCMHTTATSSLARLGKAIALPFFQRRLEDGSYVVSILPPLENFPSNDEIADTKQYVRILEAQIRRCPEQYFWVHRKFKNLPSEYPDYYADL